MSRKPRRALLAAALLLTAFTAPRAAAGPGEAVLLPSGATLVRLSPPGHDAVRPRISPDGTQVAWVRRWDPAGRAAPVPLEEVGPGARTAPGGDEIWMAPVSGGTARRRVAAPPDSGLDPGPDGYSLHDLSWSPDGSRLGFTWYDGRGWARVLVSDPGHPLLRLPVPVVSDPWEEGASFSLSATQMSWAPEGGGRTGYIVAWDDQCGSIHRVPVPPPGAAGGGPPRRVPAPEGCLSLILESPGLWLFRTRERDMAQRVGILNTRGSVIESRSFGIEAPVLARWGASRRRGRPPAVLWWREINRDHVVMSVWRRGSFVEWVHRPCRGECPEPLLVTDRGLWFLEGKGDGRRLMLLGRPGGGPGEIVPSGITALRSSADGAILVVVMRTAGESSSLWRLDLPD